MNDTLPRHDGHAGVDGEQLIEVRLRDEDPAACGYPPRDLPGTAVASRAFLERE